MFGRKKKQAREAAALAAAASAADPGWEYYNVAVSSWAGSGSKQITKTINEMQKAGWEYVSQSGTEWANAPQTNLMFRRPQGSKGKAPVGANHVGCCMLWTMSPFLAVAAAVGYRTLRNR